MNNMTNDEIEELVGLKDTDKNFLKERNNGLLLTDKQVETLNRHKINTSKVQSMGELLYMIDEAMDGCTEDECEDLEYLAEILSERKYYENTNK